MSVWFNFWCTFNNCISYFFAFSVNSAGFGCDDLNSSTPPDLTGDVDLDLEGGLGGCGTGCIGGCGTFKRFCWKVATAGFIASFINTGFFILAVLAVLIVLYYYYY